jgi:beta-phosphoglucomutase
VYSVILAGFACIGIAGGNIIESGAKSFCRNYVKNLEDLIQHVE